MDTLDLFRHSQRRGTGESWGTEWTQREEVSRKRKIISFEKDNTNLLDNWNNFLYNQILHTRHSTHPWFCELLEVHMSRCVFSLQFRFVWTLTNCCDDIVLSASTVISKIYSEWLSRCCCSACPLQCWNACCCVHWWVEHSAHVCWRIILYGLRDKTVPSVWLSTLLSAVATVTHRWQHTRAHTFYGNSSSEHFVYGAKKRGIFRTKCKI